MYQSEETIYTGSKNCQLWWTIPVQNAGFLKEVPVDSVVKGLLKNVAYEN